MLLFIVIKWFYVIMLWIIKYWKNDENRWYFDSKYVFLYKILLFKLKLIYLWFYIYNYVVDILVL